MLILTFLFLVGMALWSLLEYLIHRFLGHRKRATNPFAKEHRAHHAKIDYFAPMARKVLLAIPVLLLVAGAGALAIGLRLASVVTAGLATGWLLYERLHLRLHQKGPTGAYTHWAIRHHFDHHFMNPSTNHGVSSPVWDVVFGTYQAPRRVKVPKRAAQQMPWLPAVVDVEPGEPAPAEVEAEAAATR
ncbi:MAG: sterol desaturase family protein [Deltaproteobacteria bacterium]|nr:sterol desaturase family protein [Deltaproteobacteria bacterium]